LEDVKKSENLEFDNPEKTESEIKEEGECSEDEEKSKDLKQVNQYSLGESRFILEETTGMYYDQVTGYYYNLVSLIYFPINVWYIKIYNYRIDIFEIIYLASIV